MRLDWRGEGRGFPGAPLRWERQKIKQTLRFFPPLDTYEVLSQHLYLFGLFTVCQGLHDAFMTLWAPFCPLNASSLVTFQTSSLNVCKTISVVSFTQKRQIVWPKITESICDH